MFSVNFSHNIFLTETHIVNWRAVWLGPIALSSTQWGR